MTFRLEGTPPCHAREAERFAALIEDVRREGSTALRALFDGGRPISIARAPGRLDVMGGIADYSGSLVLELPLAEATFAAAQTATDETLRVGSVDPRDPTTAHYAEVPLGAVLDGADPYLEARSYFSRPGGPRWVAYVAGVVLALVREAKLPRPSGLRVLVASSVPEGKGVSSSAALEVACASAIAAACEHRVEPAPLALLCQRAENLVVGAACGVMDQMTAALGRADRLLALRCQPAEVIGHVAIPSSVRVWGIESVRKHQVSGSDYETVRVGTSMGYRILAEQAGLAVKVVGARRVEIEDPRWRGYLANVSPSELAERFERHLPASLRGSEFLRQYAGTADPVTSVDPSRTYPVRSPTAHAIHEGFRVACFYALLCRAGDDPPLVELGELMYQSHASYSACGLGSEETDRIVELVREVGPEGGLFGAKITGGGAGGTVAILGRAGAEGSVHRVAERYAEHAGQATTIFGGSSEGASSFGTVRLVPVRTPPPGPVHTPGAPPPGPVHTPGAPPPGPAHKEES